MMTLLEVVQKLDTWVHEDTIYAASPWTADSIAIVAPEPESGGLPPEAAEQGLEYFIEVFIALEHLSGWKSLLKVQPSLEEEVDRLIQYSINDA